MLTFRKCNQKAYNENRYLTKPRKLGDSGRFWGTFTRTLTDIVLAILCVAFIVYACLVIINKNAPVEPKSQASYLLSASTYGPTIFPILFAAVAGRFTKAIANWRLRRGARLGTIEQLVGSTTIFGTLSTHFQLRAINVLALVLVILWAFSPLGGQASLRVVSLGSQINTNQTGTSVFNVQSTFLMSGSSSQAFMNASVQAVFSASLMDPAKNRSADTWGNIKIPAIERLPPVSTTEDGWIPVAKSDSTSYTALVGIPISPMPNSNFTFNVETSYWNVDCTTFDLRNKTSPRGNASTLNSYFTMWDGRYLSFGVNNTLPRQRNSAGLKPRMILVESQGENAVTHAECALRTTYVEVQARCLSSSCAVTAMRPSRSTNNSVAAWTTLDDNLNAIWFTNNFIYSFPPTHNSVSGPLESYFVNPDSPLRKIATSRYQLYDVGRQNFEVRLAQLMNTYWLSATAAPNLLGEPPRSPSEAVAGVGMFTPVTATVSERVDVLACNMVWLVILFASAAIAFALTITAAIVAGLSHAPDVLGSALGQTLDSRWHNLTGGASLCDSLDRARWLKDVRFRLGDVDPLGEVGHVAVGIEQDTRVIADIRAGRAYI